MSPKLSRLKSRGKPNQEPASRRTARSASGDSARRREKKEPRTLTIFISYASEDLQIAHGIASALAGALPEGFAEIYFDKWALNAGEEFRSQLKSRLEKTRYLIIVSTGTQKDSYAFPAWEVGFFESLLKDDPSRKIIPLYLEQAPPSVAGFQGFNLQLPRDLLPQSIAEFSARNEVNQDDPLVSLIQTWQIEADEIKREAGFDPGIHHARKDAISTVKAIRLAVFCHMKTRVEAEMKPQKQITIRSTGVELQNSDTDLPVNALLVPTGGSSMSIFGLPEEEMTWETFLKLTTGPQQDAWREAITTVVLSGHADRINVDNSQVILSSDENKAYRIVLTTATKYWDDRRLFSLYFVEKLQREDYGDHDTTKLLKGLQTVCRYRFLFLEQSSIFSARNVISTADERLPQLAAKLLSELNLIRQDSREVDLASQAYWTNVVGPHGLREMRDEFYPREAKIRELCGQALKARDKVDVLAKIRTDLHDVIADLERVTLPFNTGLIRSIGEKLLQMMS